MAKHSVRAKDQKIAEFERMRPTKVNVGRSLVGVVEFCPESGKSLTLELTFPTYRFPPTDVRHGEQRRGNHWEINYVHFLLATVTFSQ